MTNEEAANELKCYHREDGTVPEEIILAIKALEDRPTGEWIFRQDPIYGGYYKCSECGEVEKVEKKFCSNCGAKMKGGRE